MAGKSKKPRGATTNAASPAEQSAGSALDAAPAADATRRAARGVSVPIKTRSDDWSGPFGEVGAPPPADAGGTYWLKLIGAGLGGVGTLVAVVVFLVNTWGTINETGRKVDQLTQSVDVLQKSTDRVQGDVTGLAKDVDKIRDQLQEHRLATEGKAGGR